MQLLEQVELHEECLDSVAPLGLHEHFTINWYQLVTYDTVHLIHYLPLFVTHGSLTFDFAISTNKNTPFSFLFSIFYSTGLFADWDMPYHNDDGHGYLHNQTGYSIFWSYMIVSLYNFLLSEQHITASIIVSYFNYWVFYEFIISCMVQ